MSVAFESVAIVNEHEFGEHPAGCDGWPGLARTAPASRSARAAAYAKRRTTSPRCAPVVLPMRSDGRVADDAIIIDRAEPCFFCKRPTRRIDLAFEAAAHALCALYVFNVKVSQLRTPPQFWWALKTRIQIVIGKTDLSKLVR